MTEIDIDNLESLDKATLISMLKEQVEINRTRNKTVKDQNEYMRIITSLKFAYETMILLDLTDLTFNVLNASDAVTKIVGTTKDIIEICKNFCEYFISPEYQQKFLEFLDIDTLAERLQTQRYIAVNYHTYNLGWVHARLIPAGFDSKGNITHAVFTTECVDDIYRKHESLKIASETDGLTGLYNRRAGEHAIEKLLIDNNPGMFALFDCDKFKLINDTYGHMVGDKVLVEICKVFKEVFSGQILMRLGGDEFIVYCHTDEFVSRMSEENGMNPVFSMLRFSISSIKVPELEKQKVTVSCGAVMYDGTKECTFDELYALADEALYTSKKERAGKITIVDK